jgi:hypothetical protein
MAGRTAMRIIRCVTAETGMTLIGCRAAKAHI